MDRIFVKLPDQDRKIDIAQAEFFAHYITQHYKSVNVGSIIPEYKVGTLLPIHSQTLKTTMSLLSTLFLVITIIANLITVFSVVSNLSIFIESHNKEINILRSIGFTKLQITIAYAIPHRLDSIATSSSHCPLSRLLSCWASQPDWSLATSYASRRR